MNDNEWVKMRHPTAAPDAEPAEVTRRAFELDHRHKGWVLVDDPADDQPAAAEAGAAETPETADAGAKRSRSPKEA